MSLQTSRVCSYVGEGKTLIVLPTYNEYANLSRLIPQLLALLSNADLLVIDDASPDGTGRSADEFSTKSDRVRVIHRAGKLGLGTAYIVGFGKAIEWGYEYVMQMDSDFSHRPVDLPPILEAARDSDLVIGSRNIPGGRVEGWPLLRRVISRCGSLYARLILGVPIRDFTSGLKCFRVAALETLAFQEVRSNGYGFQVEMNYLAYEAGLRVAESPIVFPDRQVGDSKMSSGILFEAMLMVPLMKYRKLRSGGIQKHDSSAESKRRLA